MSALPAARLARFLPACLSVLLCLAVVPSQVPAQQKDPVKKEDKKIEKKAAKEDKKEEKKADPVKKDEKAKPKPKEKPIPPLLELKGHTDWINQVVYRPDGKQLATASRDRTVRVWDASSGKELLTLKDNPGNVRSIAYSPDGKKLASTSGKWDKTKKEWQGEIKIRDASSGKLLQALAGHTEDIECVAYSPDGKWLASAGKDKVVIVWDAKSGKAVHTLKGHGGEVESVVFSPDSKRLASAGGVMETKDKKTITESGELKIWDVTSGKELTTFKIASRPLTSIAFGGDGRFLLMGSYDGTLALWAATSSKEAPFQKTTDGILTVAFTFTDRLRMAIGGWDREVKVWTWPADNDLFTFQKFTFKGHTNSVTSVAFSPSAPHLASASLDQTVKIWNLVPVK